MTIDIVGEGGGEGAFASEPGSREPSPAVSAASGFDPSRGDQPKRVLVCGGRDYGNHRFVWATLDKLSEGGALEAVIHGGAKGADEWARVWVKGPAQYGDGPKPRELAFPANWKKHGRAAGPIRNEQMLREGNPDLVVAFPGGAGTADMVRRARNARVWVLDLRDSDGSPTGGDKGTLGSVHDGAGLQASP